jgi:three-Cys-motif partner protein
MKENIWAAKPHTLAKIRIVEEYLKSWFPIISRHNNRIIYIDGFCGPGEYREGEKGSPIIALETALNHSHGNLRNVEIIFLFIDKKKDRIENLSELIQGYKLPRNIKVECVQGNFGGTIESILNEIESKGRNLAPTFLFIDPFGIKEASFKLIQRFMENPKCEVMVNFMVEYINRFSRTKAFEKSLNDLYGTDKWKICDRADERIKCFIETYKNQLKEIVKYCWSFEMVNDRNKGCYMLFYGTNHLLGLEKMKDAMWKIDPTGDYKFYDSYHSQLTIFEDYFDPQGLAEIYLELGRRDFNIIELEEFTIVETAYRKNHVRKALKILEERRLIKVFRKSAHGFPEGTIIRIL